MAAMGMTGMAPPMPMPAPMPAGPPMMGAPQPGLPPMMSPGGPVAPATATPLGGAGAAPSSAVDLGGMGAPPMMAPSEDDLIMTAMQAVLGKWGSGQAQIAGEKNSLLQTLMLLASSQPPQPMEGFIEGGPATNFGMTPVDQTLPSGGGGATLGY